MSAQVFTVYTDPDYGFIVAERQVSKSFAMVPASFDFSDEASAKEHARNLTAYCAAGNRVKVHMMEAPDRFEAVADTQYGCAW